MTFKKIQNNQENESGFTLIEMLVSIALFSIVIVVVMGSILTIVDVNRKSQSLTVVMNDLNFVLESVTRTIKTGSNLLGNTDGDQITVTNQDEDRVVYKFEGGAIQRSVDSSVFIDLTSTQIEIIDAKFILFNADGIDPGSKQPRVLISIEGRVDISTDISSSFKIQTTVSQRNLDDIDLYD
jgi:prepilin-type N-terminal cleavage/methylation domain-containing protein